MLYDVFKACLFQSVQVSAEETPSSALRKLKEGNERFVKDEGQLCDVTKMKRGSLVDGQNPFAIVLGCSDSRVPPEIIFDQGLGDLFTIRVAGNIVGPIVLNSIEFAALQLGAKIVVVLGHENCGAVKAVINRQTSHIETIAFNIAPAIAGVDPNSQNRLSDSIKANVKSVVNHLRLFSPVVYDLVQKGQVEVVGAYYNIATGKVDFLPN